MSCVMFTGTPGTGKSLDVARKIKKALRSGVDVIANFDINLSAVPFKRKGKRGRFFFVDNDSLSPLMLYTFARKTYNDHLSKEGKIKEGSILLVIDECQIIFNSRDYQKPDRKDWLVFFAQHRKYGYDIILVCQMERAIDKQIRGQCEKEYNHRKLSNFKKFGKILSFLMGAPIIVTVVYYKQGIRNVKDSSYVFLGSRSDYDLYDSYKIFDLAPEGQTVEGVGTHEVGGSRSTV